MNCIQNITENLCNEIICETFIDVLIINCILLYHELNCIRRLIEFLIRFIRKDCEILQSKMCNLGYQKFILLKLKKVNRFIFKSL